MDFLPISLNITNKKILFIGGGNVCLHKIHAVQQFTSNITILSIDFLPEVIDLGFECIYKSYEKNDLQNYSIIYACTNNREINKQIESDAKEYNALVNVADDPELCDFISPAIYKDEEISIAVSSGGKNVKKAVAIRNKLKNSFEKIPLSSKVYLVGFGPGDRDLLTIKADKILSQTDVIFYDNLISVEALDSYSCEKIYVGKRKGKHSKNQEEINSILYEATKKYNTIVRLKGGDPLIFGRVGEEISFLKSKGISIEVIPGISSASAAAAACGTSITHRKYASSVAYCTGHPAHKIKIPNADTLVFFMSASTYAIIIKKLLEQGRRATTPIAIITNASLPNQTITYTSIQELHEKKLQIESPSILIIGDVISLVEDLRLQISD